METSKTVLSWFALGLLLMYNVVLPWVFAEENEVTDGNGVVEENVGDINEEGENFMEVEKLYEEIDELEKISNVETDNLESFMGDEKIETIFVDSGSIIQEEHKSADEIILNDYSNHEIKDLETLDQNVEKFEIKGTNNFVIIKDTVQSYNSNYTKEQNEAYSFAKSNGITTVSSIETAKMDMSLTRIQMAKMLSNYAINVLGQEPDFSKGTVNFSDVTDKMNKQYDYAVTKAYQLGIMGQNVKSNKFRPDDEVTRAEFATALSRMIYNIEDGKGSTRYYVPHIVKLYNEGIINKANPKLKEKRGYVMLMLMRTIK